MFLPVLLLRDMGPWSFAAFALPNCIGAALLAWWMRDSAASHRFVSTHRQAIRVFSLVTLAFQWFFVAWIATGRGFSLQSLAVLAPLIAAIVLFPRSLTSDGHRRSFSLATLLSSVLLLGYFFVQFRPQDAFAALAPPLRTGDHLWPLLAVSSLGFLCCPLLDGTFHTVKQRSESATGKPEFALGFLVFFAALIGGTLLYGAYLIVDVANNANAIIPGNLPTVVLVYIMLQLGFTIIAHERWVNQFGSDMGDMGTQKQSGLNEGLALGALLVGLVLGGFGPALIGGLNINTIKLDMLPREVIYRGFLAFYGLLAPLYVIGCALNVGIFASRAPGASLPRLAALVAIAAIATPFYYKGFIERDTPQLFAGVAIAMLGAMGTRFLPGPKGLVVAS